MTDEQDTGWRSEEVRRARGFRLPWLALAGVVATVVAAATLVIGIGDSLGGDRPAGRLLPLQAASPPTPSPSAPSPSAPSPSAPSPTKSSTARSPEDTREPPDERPGHRLREALLMLRDEVDEGVVEGDVRDDVGIDLSNVIEWILDRPSSPSESRRADVAYLHHKIATRTREGAIDDDRADDLHQILERATD